MQIKQTHRVIFGYSCYYYFQNKEFNMSLLITLLLITLFLIFGRIILGIIGLFFNKNYKMIALFKKKKEISLSNLRDSLEYINSYCELE